MFAEIFGPDPFILMIFGIVIPIWAIGDALSRPASAFYGAGSNKTAWVVVLMVTTFLGLGVLLGAFYLISVRRKVRRQMDLLLRG